MALCDDVRQTRLSILFVNLNYQRSMKSTKDVLHKLNQLLIKNPNYALMIKMCIEAQGFKLPTRLRSAQSRSSSHCSVASMPSL